MLCCGGGGDGGAFGEVSLRSARFDGRSGGEVGGGTDGVLAALCLPTEGHRPPKVSRGRPMHRIANWTILPLQHTSQSYNPPLTNFRVLPCVRTVHSPRKLHPLQRGANGYVRGRLSQFSMLGRWGVALLLVAPWVTRVRLATMAARGIRSEVFVVVGRSVPVCREVNQDDQAGNLL